jgi:phage N-6-adenine-methyltransferase
MGDRNGNENSAQTCAKFPQGQLEELSGFSHQTISRFRKRMRDQAAYERLLRGPSWRKAMGLRSSDQRGASGTGENEWFTPIEYITLARSVLGEIDLDPATSKIAQEKIGAASYFTKQDDGLLKQWSGRVWLNPPYAQPLIGQFVRKLIDERRDGRVTAAILLTHNYTDTAWFQEAAALADAICFTRGRIKFYEPGGEAAAPTQGQAFSYFGDNAASFAAVFAGVGFVVVPLKATVIAP